MEEKQTPRRIEELKDFLSKMQAGDAPLEKLRTYMNEIMILSCHGLNNFAQTVTLHYTADSLVHEFLFADGKKYRMEITEVKEKKSE